MVSPLALRPRKTTSVVDAQGLSKRFGATQALSEVSLAIESGEIRGLLGRNGAGKSTLVSCLTGLTVPDTGTIIFRGEPAPPSAEVQLWQSSVACVYQHPKIFPTLSIAENLFLSENLRRKKLLSWEGMRRHAREILSEWGLELDVEQEAGTLDVAERQLIEIARALVRGSRFVILDEPTAKLNAREIGRLFKQLRALKARGVGILFISHHLDEVFELCDSVTVLRDGHKVREGAVAEFDRLQLIEAMVGTRSENATTPDAAPTEKGTVTDVRLEVSGLSLPGCFECVSFEVSAGECVGVAGLTGCGKEALGEALAGLKAWTAGDAKLDGTALPGGSVATHNRAGIGFVPQDRHVQGLVLDMNVAENATMSIPDRLGPLGFIRPRTLEEVTRRLIRELEIKTRGPGEAASSLSGGNQQKLVLARALARDPRVLVLINPTAGVDVASKVALFTAVSQVVRRGAAVVLISDELEELDICDRILVMHQHRLKAEFFPPYAGAPIVAAMEGVNR